LFSAVQIKVVQGWSMVKPNMPLKKYEPITCAARCSHDNRDRLVCAKHFYQLQLWI
jgi:hypothetical protein